MPLPWRLVSPMVPPCSIKNVLDDHDLVKPYGEVSGNCGEFYHGNPDFHQKQRCIWQSRLLHLRRPRLMLPIICWKSSQLNQTRTVLRWGNPCWYMICLLATHGYHPLLCQLRTCPDISGQDSVYHHPLPNRAAIKDAAGSFGWVMGSLRDVLPSLH